MGVRYLIAGLGLSLSMSACVSTSGSTQKVSASDIHVHQTNGKDVLTELDRNHWINVRKTSNSDEMKLYSSLGAREWDVAASDARAYLATHSKNLVAMQVLSVALTMKNNYSLSSFYS